METPRRGVKGKDSHIQGERKILYTLTHICLLITMKKYPKIKRIGDKENKGIFKSGKKVIVTEKMDGANFRFKIEENNFWYGSRNKVELGDNKKQFKEAIVYIEEKTNPGELNEEAEKIIGHENLTFFGECMTRHSLSYDWENVPGFLGFDIFDHDLREFVPFDKVKEIYNSVGLEVVPKIEEIDVKSFAGIEDYSIPDSEHRDGIAEGVVFKNYSNQLFAKLRSEEFMEENNKTFGQSKKHVETDNEKFVAEYCTNARIEKWIYKLRDGGHYIEMSLMEHLPKKVWMDIWEENMDDIIWGQREIDMHQTRSLVSSRCAKVLKKLIINKGLKNE